MITAKFARDYVDATTAIDLNARLDTLRAALFREIDQDTLRPIARIGIRPQFFDPADHWSQLDVPLPGLHLTTILEALRGSDLAPSSGPLRRIGASRVVQSIETLFAAAELWALTRDDIDLRAIALTYNNVVSAYNEFAQSTSHLALMAPVRLPEPVFTADLTAHLAKVLDIEARVGCMR